MNTLRFVPYSLYEWMNSSEAPDKDGNGSLNGANEFKKLLKLVII